MSDNHQLITVEGRGFNNSLAATGNCPNAHNEIGSCGKVQADKWARIYTKLAVDRLAPYISGLNLNHTHIVAMQELCAYEVRIRLLHYR